LNWFLEGTRKLLQDIAQHGDIALSQRQNDHIKSLLLESDSLRLFVKQSVSRSEGSDLAVSELVESYMKFCTDSGWSPIPANVVHRQLDEILLELFAVSKSAFNDTAQKSAAIVTSNSAYLQMRTPFDSGTLGTPISHTYICVCTRFATRGNEKYPSQASQN
jgi:hypothetical protein